MLAKCLKSGVDLVKIRIFRLTGDTFRNIICEHVLKRYCESKEREKGSPTLTLSNPRPSWSKPGTR